MLRTLRRHLDQHRVAWATQNTTRPMWMERYRHPASMRPTGWKRTAAMVDMRRQP
jgi:hypothetical protein